MGHEKTWCGKENEHLARAWLVADEDLSVSGVRTRKLFKESVRHCFLAIGPTNVTARKGRYGSRSIVNTDEHFSNLTDFQKFRYAIEKIKAAGPTGVSDREIDAMAIAIHCGKTSL